jgi:hypothetical protein
MPVPVNRHLVWGRSPYGFAPAFMALADARQLNELQAHLDALVELQVEPRIIAPADFKGNKIDLRSGGVTFFKTGSAPPQEWATAGDYRAGQERVMMRRQSLNQAFHVDLFQSLKEVPPGKQMTKAEVDVRQRDRLTLFSPTFANKTTELNGPTIKRVFGILLRAGAFPPPPPNVVRTNAATGLPEIPDPQIVYTSRLALQLKAIQNDAFQRVIQQAAPLFQFAPEVADNLNSDRAFRLIARNEGLPEEMLTAERDRDQMRRQRAEAQAAAQQEQAAMMEADAAAKLGNAGLI